MADRASGTEALVGSAPAGERVRGSTPVVLLAIRGGRLAELILQRALRPLGLDGSQMAVLYALSSTRPDHRLAHGDLCRLLAQTPSGVTRTVRRLEQRGLVERLTDPGDGRATIVALTAEGHVHADVSTAEMLRAFEDVLASGGVDDVTDLVEPLTRLVTVLATERAEAVASATRVASQHNDAVAGAPIGEHLRRARDARGLSQRALAQRLGVGAPHLSKVETGNEQPSRALLGRAAAELGLDPDELVLRAGLLPTWAADAAAADPVGALGALRRWAAGGGH